MPRRLRISSGGIAYHVLNRAVARDRICPDAIVPLLSFFDDAASYDEVMFSIIHGMEVFDDEVYVAQLLRGAVGFCAQSARWASIVFMRTLNSEATRRVLIRQLRTASPATKVAVKSLMEMINARELRFLAKTTAVILAAS